MWTLRATGTTTPRTLRLPPGAVKTVGRGPRADFVVEALLLSRVHCRLSATDRQLVVEDLDSTNGTFVNDTRVACIALKPGDRLRLGRAEFEVGRDESG